MDRIEALRDAPVVAEHLCWNAFRSARHRLFYVATPKVACSLLKWWFAALEGRTQDILRRTESSESAPELVIHEVFHKVAPDITGLSLDDLRDPLEASDYFRFALVRNPYWRLFSAWQSKLLLREPLQIAPYRGFDFMTLPIGSKADIRSAFEAFLHHLHDFEAPNFWDPHWRPQVQMLRPDVIPYSLVAKLEEPAELEKRLATHLGPHYVAPFTKARPNESLIPFLPEFVSDTAAALIQQLYAADFSTFGYPTNVPAARAKFSDAQLTTACAAIEMLRARHRRLTETRDHFNLSLDRLGGDVERLTHEARERDAQVSELRGTAERLGREITQRDARIAELDKQVLLSANELERAHADLWQGAAERLGGDVARLDKRLTEVSDQISANSKQLAQVREQNQQALANSSRPQDAPLQRALGVLARLASLSKRGSAASRQTAAGGAETFDPDFYLKMYPDIARAGINPAEHYRLHGKGEGRLGCMPPLDIAGSFASLSQTRDTVLVVSHEASLTGAPVLCLNIAQQLASRYNVVAMLLGGGAIEGAFRECCPVVLKAPAPRGYPVGEALVRGLPQNLDVKFAVVNSIESRWVLPSLAQRGIPTISLIHEFASYTRPRDSFRDALLWSTKTVFSTEITVQSARDELWELEDWPPVRVLPQGLCRIPKLELQGERLVEERARIAGLMRPGVERKFNVLGAGYIHFRKGVDLFIQCAAHVLRQAGPDRARFFWIGAGFDSEHDAGYSVFLADQIRRSGLEGLVTFVEATPAIQAAYAEADVLLLSSRLDPLPNVAIDAMTRGVPVICFENTTGMAAILRDAGLGDDCVAQYLDTADMAGKVVALLESKTLCADLGARARALALEQFDMSRYVEALENIGAAAQARARQEPQDVEDILRSGIMRFDFSVPDSLRGLTPGEATARYVRTWACGWMRRKPLPGFHPAVYQAQHGLRAAAADSFADYIREGCPAGPWRMPVIDSKTPVGSGHANSLRVGIHLHVYYPEILPDIVERLSRNALRADLFVSVPSEDVRDRALATLTAYRGRVHEVSVVANRGRDIGPLLTAFGPRLVRDYEVIGHFHTKASRSLHDAGIGHSWNRFILENLLGGRGGEMADRIIAEMAADAELGLVFPDDPNVVGWTKNRTHAERLAERLGIGTLPDHFSFPVGTMFWARAAALKPLVDLGLDWSDYPEEPLPIDGTMLHAIERLLPAVANSVGLNCAVTNVEGVSR